MTIVDGGVIQIQAVAPGKAVLVDATTGRVSVTKAPKTTEELEALAVEHSVIKNGLLVLTPEDLSELNQSFTGECILLKAGEDY